MKSAQTALATLHEESGMEIIHGNCLEVMPDLPRASFDVILTDPPYAMPASYYPTTMTAVEGRARSWSDTLIMKGWFERVADIMMPLLKPGGWVLIFCDVVSCAVFLQCIYPHCSRVSSLVWDKQSMALGMPFRRQHELILAGRVPGPTDDKGSSFSDVIQCPRVPAMRRSHPAQKPVELLSALLRAVAPNGGRALDPFAGSCSTGYAAQAVGMESVMIEYTEKS